MEQHDISTDPQCPMELITDSFVRDPHPVLAAMREAAPAVPVDNRGYRMWVVTRYDDVRRILASPRSFKDLVVRRRDLIAKVRMRNADPVKMADAARRSVFERDGEDHSRLRALLAPEFTEQAVARRAPRITELAETIAADLPTGEPVDLLARFIRPFVTRTIGEVVGLPEEDLGEFPRWVDLMHTGTTAEIGEAAMNMVELSRRTIDHKRAHPGDDVYTRLVRMREEGRLDEDELVSTCMVLLIAGSEPNHSIANTLLMLLRNPDQLALLRADLGRMDAAIAEGLRMESPFRILPPRFSDLPIELDGVVIPPLDLVVPSPASANRDPGKFADPDVFDIGRTAPASLAFGHGPHRCPGIVLGRLETKLALTALLERFPAISAAVPTDQLEWRPGFYMRRLEKFPVVLG
ncbi:cytochrome P450 [Lentzea sp. NPDC059081]|uniref:cytochrome P450 n=1 Tax=Lentzea sp. NPDC059081 TaxID=3346719 RepID=UPI0036AB57B5